MRGPNVVIMSGAGKPIFVRYNRDNNIVKRSCRLDDDVNDKSIFGRNISHNCHHDDQESEDKAEEGEEEEWATACSVLQALRANVISFGISSDSDGIVASPLGDIQSIRAGKKILVFLNTEALTLVAISDKRVITDKKKSKCNSDSIQEDQVTVRVESEAWLRLQLEYVYSQVIFTLTNQIQDIFCQSPNYDLRAMLGPNVNASLRTLLNRFDPVDLDYIDNQSCRALGRNNSQEIGCGSFLTAGVECISPIPPEIRDGASKLLLSACRYGGSVSGSGRYHSSQEPLFALLMVGTRLVTLVQPSHPSSQLHTSDLHLILTFVGLQPGLLTNELWFPLCLPRFDSSGFLYAYSSCLDPDVTKLSIILISPNNSTEQFESLRLAATRVRRSLGLMPVKSSILRIYDSASSVSSSVITPTASNQGTDIKDSESENTSPSAVRDSNLGGHFDDSAWTREGTDDDDIYEDDESAGKGIIGRIGAASVIPSIVQRRGAHTYYNEKDQIYSKASSFKEDSLISALKVAMSTRTQEDMIGHYLQLSSAVHFIFRCDIFNNSPNGSAAAEGMLSQCFGPPFSFPFIDSKSQCHVWNIYQRLALRLRLGSASVETTMDALDMVVDSQENVGVESRGISIDCPMQCLLESPPNVHGVTYVLENHEWLYVGLNGKFFELYATLPGNIAPRIGTAYCARLVRKLMEDERSLFLSNPLTWDS